MIAVWQMQQQMFKLLGNEKKFILNSRIGCLTVQFLAELRVQTFGVQNQLVEPYRVQNNSLLEANSLYLRLAS